MALLGSYNTIICFTIFLLNTISSLQPSLASSSSKTFSLRTKFLSDSSNLKIPFVMICFMPLPEVGTWPILVCGTLTDSYTRNQITWPASFELRSHFSYGPQKLGHTSPVATGWLRGRTFGTPLRRSSVLPVVCRRRRAKSNRKSQYHDR